MTRLPLQNEAKAQNKMIKSLTGKNKRWLNITSEKKKVYNSETPTLDFYFRSQFYQNVVLGGVQLKNVLRRGKFLRFLLATTMTNSLWVLPHRQRCRSGWPLATMYCAFDHFECLRELYYCMLLLCANEWHRKTPPIHARSTWDRACSRSLHSFLWGCKLIYSPD